MDGTSSSQRARPRCQASKRRIVPVLHKNTATTAFYTLSLHDALPISRSPAPRSARAVALHRRPESGGGVRGAALAAARSEEHTSELQSLTQVVCRLLLEKQPHQARVDAASPETAQRAVGSFGHGRLPA